MMPTTNYNTARQYQPISRHSSNTRAASQTHAQPESAGRQQSSAERSHAAPAPNLPHAGVEHIQDSARARLNITPLTAFDKLSKADRERLSKLYNRDNFTFATESEGRKPTLYFKNTKGVTGRLRQEHSKGGLINDGKNQGRSYFFESEEKRSIFSAKVAESYTMTLKEMQKLAEEVGAHQQPFAGAFHNEYIFYESAKPEHSFLKGSHESQGRVVDDSCYQELKSQVPDIFEHMTNNPNVKIGV